jgi:hypothetical protein
MRAFEMNWNFKNVFSRIQADRFPRISEQEKRTAEPNNGLRIQKKSWK